MSPGLAIVLIIVLWLLILAPVLLRGQKPMSRTGEAFDDTRVLFEGDSGELESQRGPKLSAKAARIKARKEAAQANAEPADSDDAENIKATAAATDATTDAPAEEKVTGHPQTIASAAARIKSDLDTANFDNIADSAAPAAAESSTVEATTNVDEAIDGEIVEDESTVSTADNNDEAVLADDIIDAEIVDEQSEPLAATSAEQSQSTEQSKDAVSAEAVSADADSTVTAAQAVPVSAVVLDGEDELLDEEDDILLEDEPREKPAAKSNDENASAGGVSAAEGQVFTAPAPYPVADDAYGFDDTYLSPVDMMYPGAVDAELEATDDIDSTDTIDAAEDITSEAEDETAATDASTTDAELAEVDEYGDEFEASVASVSAHDDSDLSEEELEFAQSRVGRGGWDPEADAVKKATLYQRRQRTLLGLAGVVVLTVALGIIFGSWLWWTAAIAGVLTVAYLVALRTQVRQEQQLRARRISQLRRARLGVRSAHDEELAIPRQLRRPGAVIVEIDDNSPDWDHLPEMYEEHEEAPHPSAPRRQRRDDLAARRVG